MVIKSQLELSHKITIILISTKLNIPLRFKNQWCQAPFNRGQQALNPPNPRITARQEHPSLSQV